MYEISHPLTIADRYAFLNMQPHNYTFELQAMTNEKMEFTLPGVFTIGPKVRQRGLG